MWSISLARMFVQKCHELRRYKRTFLEGQKAYFISNTFYLNTALVKDVFIGMHTTLAAQTCRLLPTIKSINKQTRGNMNH